MSDKATAMALDRQALALKLLDVSERAACSTRPGRKYRQIDDLNPAGIAGVYATADFILSVYRPKGSANE